MRSHPTGIAIGKAIGMDIEIAGKSEVRSQPIGIAKGIAIGIAVRRAIGIAIGIAGDSEVRWETQ